MKHDKAEPKLTDEQKAAYIEYGFSKCPYCGSYEVSSGHFEVDGASAWQPVHCDNCEKDWRDVYTLTEIEEEE